MTGEASQSSEVMPGRSLAHGEFDGDDLRQALHELRTPVNAIQGFAELIREELFGPAPERCRRLAQGIADDAALILAGLAAIERHAGGWDGDVRPSLPPPAADEAGRDLLADRSGPQ